MCAFGLTGCHRQATPNPAAGGNGWSIDQTCLLTTTTEGGAPAPPHVVNLRLKGAREALTTAQLPESRTNAPGGSARVDGNPTHSVRTRSEADWPGHRLSPTLLVERCERDSFRRFFHGARTDTNEGFHEEH
jgi:hypothetical protein